MALLPFQEDRMPETTYARVRRYLRARLVREINENGETDQQVLLDSIDNIENDEYAVRHLLDYLARFEEA